MCKGISSLIDAQPHHSSRVSTPYSSEQLGQPQKHPANATPHHPSVGPQWENVKIVTLARISRAIEHLRLHNLRDSSQHSLRFINIISVEISFAEVLHIGDLPRVTGLLPRLE